MDNFKWGHVTGIYQIWMIIFAGICLYYGHRKRLSILHHLLDSRHVLSMVSGWNSSHRLLRALLLLSSLFFGIFAFMEPRYDYSWEIIRKKGIDILFALDISNSMQAKDIHPSRLMRAKREIQNLIQHLNSDQVGLILFTTQSVTQCPLTLDYATFGLFLKDAETGILPKGGTSVSKAIEQAILSFDDNTKRQKVLIIISDGESHDKRLNDTLFKAEKNGIRIFSLGVGTSKGATLQNKAKNGVIAYQKDQNGKNVITRLKSESLKQAAMETGGKYIEINPAAFNLETLYLTHIASLKGDMLQTKRKKRYKHRFYIPLLISVLLLLFETYLSRNVIYSKNGAKSG